jgi:Transposase DNA-binding/Transposase Tn5 dimerisation domain
MIAPWASEEMSEADFGDERLDRRAQSLLSTLGTRPNLSIPAACNGRAEMKAAYGFFDNAKVTLEKVLEPHCACTRARVAKQEIALLVQDTSEIELTRPEQDVVGVGELDGARRGFLLHEMHAFTPEGTPLGTVWAEVVNRTEGVSHAPTAEKERERKQTPIEEKESMRWLTALQKARELAQELPEVCCICVGDSEADIYELFAEPRGAQPVHWLFRACQDRAVDGGGSEHIRAQVLATPLLYQVELKIRGRQAKTTAEDRARRQNRVTRQATVEVRAKTVTLRAPYRPDRKLPPVQVNVVLVREPNPPPGEPPVEWMLLTTLPIATPEQVRPIVEYYCIRWCIEVFFRTLKSGCRIERRRFEHIDRVLPCLALYLIVAWRTLFVCHLGRECPDLDCETIFEPSEWKAVWVAVHNQKPPEKRPRLSEMVHLIASLGGYIERRNSEPGAQTVWIGMQRMYDLAWAWERFGPEAKIEKQLTYGAQRGVDPRPSAGQNPANLQGILRSTRATPPKCQKSSCARRYLRGHLLDSGFLPD